MAIFDQNTLLHRSVTIIIVINRSIYVINRSVTDIVRNEHGLVNSKMSLIQVLLKPSLGILEPARKKIDW